MPPKAKYKKEEIISAAVDIVREGGIDALTSRSLGKRLGTSSCPIFTAFENMEEVNAEVLTFANKTYKSYLEREMASGAYPPYKASGMGYIKFAREERELFKLLFMRDRSGEKITDGREELRPILEIIIKNLGISEDDAYRLHLEMWIYVHGIATMIATSYLEWDHDFISQTLSDAYQGFICRYKKGA